MENSIAMCACRRVKYNPILLDGTESGRMQECWRCEDCGTVFVKSKSITGEGSELPALGSYLERTLTTGIGSCITITAADEAEGERVVAGWDEANVKQFAKNWVARAEARQRLADEAIAVLRTLRGLDIDAEVRAIRRAQAAETELAKLKAALSSLQQDGRKTFTEWKKWEREQKQAAVDAENEKFRSNIGKHKFIGKPVDSECFYGYHAPRCKGCNCTCHIPSPPVTADEKERG